MRPRAPVHRGHVDAVGFVVDEALLGSAARARVLALWRPGARVLRAGTRLVVLLPVPVRVRAERAPGAPLVAAEGLLSACPLDAKERAALAAPPGALVLVAGGRAEVFATLPDEDPAAWIDLGAFTPVAVTPLGTPPAPPPLAPVAAPDVRAVLRVPPADPALAALRARLRGERAPEGAGRPAGAGLAFLRAALSRRGGARAPAGPPGPLERLAGALAGLLARPSARAAAPARGLAPQTVPARPGLLSRFVARFRRPDGPGGAPPKPSLLDRLRAFAAQRLLDLGLARHLGRLHARHLAETLDLLSRGRFDEALRRAIPLGDLDAPAPTVPSLSAPSVRSDLSIRVEPRRAPGGGVALPSDLFADVRRRYREACERLVALGRYDEAAFVLAELLGADEEAVALLERHDRKRLAAELAEARNLAPGLVIRQWMIAGDRQRALQVARRTGAYADAVARLEGTEVAAVLRAGWADLLASGGDYAGAVDVIWPVASARHLAVAWMERAIEAGGPAGARLLARRLGMGGADAEVLGARVRALLDDPDAAEERLAFADALDGQPAWSRPTARALVRDVAGADGDRAEMLRRHVRRLGDAVLGEDLPPLPTPPPPRWPVRVTFADAGTLPVWDAAALPDGRTLVALGEGGLRVLTRDGRIAGRLETPAHRLVVADNGLRALALARRGEAWRVTPVDPIRRTAGDGVVLRLDAFAPDFDGTLWFVARDDAVMALDVLDPELAALWRLRDVGGPVGAVARARDACLVLVDGPTSEIWRLSLPDFVLRARADAAKELGEVTLGAPLSGHGAIVLPCEERSSLLFAGARPRAAVLVTGVLAASPAWVVSRGETVQVRTSEGEARADLSLPGAARVAARIQGTLLVLADDRGRVVHFDAQRGAVVRSLRV